jgi:predicted HAD superfamily Cof-like phosphohydrolase
VHRAQQQVRDFHRARDLRRPDEFDPDYRILDDVYLWHIREEVEELESALVPGNDITGIVDALCDIIYLVYGAAVSCGIDLEPYFEEVHRANMEKCQGAVNGEGRQTKPEGWSPPNLRAIFDREFKQ